MPSRRFNFAAKTGILMNSIYQGYKTRRDYNLRQCTVISDIKLSMERYFGPAFITRKFYSLGNKACTNIPPASIKRYLARTDIRRRWIYYHGNIFFPNTVHLIVLTTGSFKRCLRSSSLLEGKINLIYDLGSNIYSNYTKHSVRQLQYYFLHVDIL